MNKTAFVWNETDYRVTLSELDEMTIYIGDKIHATATWDAGITMYTGPETEPEFFDAMERMVQQNMVQQMVASIDVDADKWDRCCAYQDGYQ
jgi:hypothetical protein